jgi:hypothetical protein
MTKLHEIIDEQNNLIKSFKESKGLFRRRIDTSQVWVDKSNNIADAVIRKRIWRFGILTHDYLQTINNDDSSIKGFTGFKKS